MTKGAGPRSAGLRAKHRQSRAGKQPSKAAAPVRTNRARLFIAALGVLLAASGVGIGWWSWNRSAPVVVVPHDLQEIDPQLRAYITQHIEWAREDPRAAQRHATLALVYAANKHWAEARDAFCVAVDLAPRDVMASYYLAIATREAGDHETAVDLLRKVMKQHPTFAPAYHRLGYALLDSGRIQDAARALGRAKELKPDAPEAYVGLAAARLRERDYAGAEELLQKAFGLGTKDRTAH